jgi:hypothetical protein
MLRLVRRKLCSLRNRVVRYFWPPPDPYTTHLPVLIGLARLFSVRRVLEFGCGRFSTLTFLDRQAFPHLETLVSQETERDWMERVRTMTHSDPRVSFIFQPYSMAVGIHELDLDQFDLVFVDDSATIEDRAATIRAVMARPFAVPLVVFHDMENPFYQPLVNGYLDRFEFTAFTPNTWIVWGRCPTTKERFAEIDGIIGRYSHRYNPADIRAWVQAFQPLVQASQVHQAPG